MKSWLKYLLLGVFCYFSFLIVQLPADKTYYFVEDLLDDANVPLEIYGLNGSVWKGSANTLIYDDKRFDSVEWELHPMDLLTGKASVSIRLKGQGSSFDGRLSKSITGETLLQNSRANIEAMALLKLLKIPAIKLGGDLTLNLNRMEITGQTVGYISGRLLWTAAESQFPQKLTLGTIYSDFSTSDDGVIQAKLGDGGGPLELNGNATVAPDGKYDAKGVFSAREGRQSALGRSLGFIAKYDASGKAAFNRTGNISEFGFLVK